jgi:hypothetical protein
MSPLVIVTATAAQRFITDRERQLQLRFADQLYRCIVQAYATLLSCIQVFFVCFVIVGSERCFKLFHNSVAASHKLHHPVKHYPYSPITLLTDSHP